MEENCQKIKNVYLLFFPAAHVESIGNDLTKFVKTGKYFNNKNIDIDFFINEYCTKLDL